MAETVGFIGLGIMGKPMARNLLRARMSLVVHSRSRLPVDELVGEGADSAGSPREVASRSDVVITMLPDTPDVEKVMLADDGVIQGAARGTLVIDMSTIDPLATGRIAQAFAERRVTFLDAPVSGGERGAVEGTLSIMAGGEEEGFARAEPLFSVMGKSAVLVGPTPAGQITKACNQLIVGATIQAVAEALVLAAKARVDPIKVRAALIGGFAGSKVLEVHGERMLEGDFVPGFRTALHRKDARIVLDTARSLSVSVPSFEVVAKAFGRLVEEGGGDLDHAALVTLLEGDSDVSVREAAGRNQAATG